MYVRLGESEEERAANLARIKVWLGGGLAPSLDIASLTLVGVAGHWGVAEPATIVKTVRRDPVAPDSGTRTGETFVAAHSAPRQRSFLFPGGSDEP